MPLVQPMPFVRSQWFDSNGDPVRNGFLYSYAAGTNTPLATYNDHTGSPGALNPNPVLLDSGGYADVWLTASSYKLVLQNSDHVQLWSIDGVPGLGSLISVGNLPPLFSSVLAGGALNFTFDPVGAHLLFGRFAGTTGDPSYGAVGSNKQITFNNAGQMVGSDNLLFDDATRTFSVRDNGNDFFSVTSVLNSGEGEIHFGDRTSVPRIKSVLGLWSFTSRSAQDMQFGPANDPQSTIIGGDGIVPHGWIRTGIGSANGVINLNNGNNGAGIFAGPEIIAGSESDPNSVYTAPQGSLFLSTGGGAAATLWVKETGSDDMGWVSK